MTQQERQQKEVAAAQLRAMATAHKQNSREQALRTAQYIHKEKDSPTSLLKNAEQIYKWLTKSL